MIRDPIKPSVFFYNDSTSIICPNNTYVVILLFCYLFKIKHFFIYTLQKCQDFEKLNVNKN